jgi:hypothetical protein
MTTKESYTIHIARRPWYEWVLWAIWLFLEIFLLQNAIASGAEFEPHAATIFWISLGVLLLGGIVVWITRRSRLTV